MATVQPAATDAAQDDRCAITFRVEHLLDYRDTAEIARILAVCRELGFVPLAEYLARPYIVPEGERRLPRWREEAPMAAPSAVQPGPVTPPTP